jgi:uncharacterized Zn finger protein
VTEDIDIKCPSCGGNVRVRLADVGRQRTVRCRSGHKFRLRDRNGGVRKLSMAVKDLEQAIRRLGAR